MASRRKFTTRQAYGSVELRVDTAGPWLHFAAEYGHAGHISGTKTLERLALAILAELKPKRAKRGRRDG
jgi:hypothetical protein